MKQEEEQLKDEGTEQQQEIEHKASIRVLFNRVMMGYIALVGALLLLILYVFVYMKYTQLTEELEASNKQLEKKVAVLKEYYDNMPTYEKEIGEMKEGMEEIFAEYPADAREEDVLMVAVEVQEETEISYSNINISKPAEVLAITQQLVTAAQIEELTMPITFHNREATYVVETDYHNIKDCVQLIYDRDNRIAVHNIALSKDTGSEVLKGNVDVSFYSIEGTGKEYVLPDIEEYISGTEDIFDLE